VCYQNVKNMTIAMSLAVAVILLLLPNAAALLGFQRVVGHRNGDSATRLLMARVSKPDNQQASRVVVGASGDEGGKDPEGDDMITLPFDGLVGKRSGGLFDKPLEAMDNEQAEFDRLSDEEKRIFVDRKISARIEAIKRGDAEPIPQSKDPLEGMTTLDIMRSALAVTKPFDSWSDFALAYILAIFTTLFVLGYNVLLTENLGNLMDWFLDTDFAGTAAGTALRL